MSDVILIEGDKVVFDPNVWRSYSDSTTTTRHH